MESKSDEMFPAGVSGPRRTTQEPMETAAANAEAARMADELGISSSVRLSAVRRDVLSPSSSTTSKKKKRGFKLFGRSPAQKLTKDDETGYQAVLADGTASNIGLHNRPSKASNTPRVSTSSPYTNRPSNQSSPFYAKTPDSTISLSEHMGYRRHDDTDDLTVRTEEPHVFDANGNRAPYREGPYDFHHLEDGRLIRKRWCK